MKKTNKKGFTLMEMLIVVAIIAILVAISIPVFTSQLDKARQATDEANIRAAKAAAVLAFIDGEDGAGTAFTIDAGGSASFVYDAANGQLIYGDDAPDANYTKYNGTLDQSNIPDIADSYLIVTITDKGVVTVAVAGA